MLFGPVPWGSVCAVEVLVPYPDVIRRQKGGVMFGTFLEGPSGLIKFLFPSPTHKHTPKWIKLYS